MKSNRIAFLLVSSLLLSSCAYMNGNSSTTRLVSEDYTATGVANEARAYVYGNRTVLELTGSYAFLSIRDESGASIDFEKLGQNYLFNGIFDEFTVSLNGRSLAFSAVKTTQAFSAPLVEKNIPTPISSQKKPSIDQADTNIIALLNLSEKQLNEIRQILDAAGKNPAATGSDLFVINQRLDEIEARLAAASAALVRVSFAVGSTAFKPTPSIAAILIAAGKNAESVNIRGRTDSRIAGGMDAKISMGRAIATRKFLVSNGVSADKIKISSQADGDFAVPNLTNASKAINRRVEIEFVNSRIAELQNQTTKLAFTK